MNSSAYIMNTSEIVEKSQTIYITSRVRRLMLWMICLLLNFMNKIIDKLFFFFRFVPSYLMFIHKTNQITLTRTLTCTWHLKT